MTGHTEINARDQKGIMFMSVSSPDAARQLIRAKAKDILVSYHYIKTNGIYEREILDEIDALGGYFMTDSGAFTIFGQYKGKRIPDEIRTEEYWLPYIEEYVKFLSDNSHKIYVAANLDLDNIVGRDVVDRWNETYFKPLEKAMNMIYITQQDDGYYADLNGMKRLKEYCAIHDYVGVNAGFAKQVNLVAQQARITNTRIHGFALTGTQTLVKYPLFSVDSTTWLGGARYGTTYVNKGFNNFSLWDYKHKHYRKSLKFNLSPLVDFDKFLADDVEAVNYQNIHGWWEGIRYPFLKACELKLSSQKASYYDKRGNRGY